MSDHTALWLLFSLLSVLFVLVVVTARRGPWSKPHESAGILWIPAELATRGYGHWSAFAEDDERFVADLRSALQSGAYDGALVPEVRIMAPGVDPLWGKNPPIDFTREVAAQDRRAKAENPPPWS